jgi:hypothetical protein
MRALAACWRREGIRDNQKEEGLEIQVDAGRGGRIDSN